MRMFLVNFDMKNFNNGRSLRINSKDICLQIERKGEKKLEGISKATLKSIRSDKYIDCRSKKHREDQKY